MQKSSCRFQSIDCYSRSIDFSHNLHILLRRIHWSVFYERIIMFNHVFSSELKQLKALITYHDARAKEYKNMAREEERLARKFAHAYVIAVMNSK